MDTIKRETDYATATTCLLYFFIFCLFASLAPRFAFIYFTELLANVWRRTIEQATVLRLFFYILFPYYQNASEADSYDVYYYYYYYRIFSEKFPSLICIHIFIYIRYLLYRFTLHALPASVNKIYLYKNMQA